MYYNSAFPPLSMPQYYAGIGFGGYGSIFDRFPIGYNSWLKPQTFIYHIYEKREPEFQARELNKRYGKYWIRERNGRNVEIGSVVLKDKFIVNANPDRTFACLSCMLKLDEKNEKIPVTIPYKDLMRHNILAYLPPELRRNPDCPERYITMAFFDELMNGDDIKFLQSPKHSGWNRDEQHAFFVSAETTIPQLSAYYAPNIHARKLPRTETTLADAARTLSKELPPNWKAKLLLAASTACYLLPFFADAGLQPDKLLIIKPDSEQNAKFATALLSTQNYSDTRSCLLTECRTVLEKELNTTYDGMCVFRDSSYTENRKRREAGLDVLIQDLNRGQGLDETSRHMISIIADNPGLYASELPAITLCLSGCIETDNLHQIRKRIGVFHGALVRLLESLNPNENLVTYALKNAPRPPRSIRQQGLIQTETIICLTLFILLQYRLLTKEEYQAALQFLRSDETEALDSDVEILNDFRSVFSEWLLQHPNRVVPQFGPPYKNKIAGAVITDTDYVNLQRDTLDFIVARMKKTQKRNVVLAALKACGKLHSNNNYKRMLEVETYPGNSTSLFVYSIPQKFLTSACQAMLKTVSLADRLFDPNCLPEDFLPLISINGNQAAGRIVNDETDEAESLYASGQTRSGKSFFLAQHAVIRAAFGERLIIFDQTGAFSQEELKKHLPAKIINDFFSFWEIGKNGLPVDLLSLKHCHSLPENKQQLFSIFSVEARITGDVQGKRLRKQLPKIVRAIEDRKVNRLSDTLSFFDPNDPEQKDIKERLEEAFDDLQGLPESRVTWAEFLTEQSKIVVISTAADGIRKCSQHIDALLASLYAWKQHYRSTRLTIVLDELEDLCLEKDGPIGTILRKGGKHRLSMMLASQEFSNEKDLLGKLIGNCGTLVFFRPKDADINSIAHHIGCDRQLLAQLQQGECIVKAGFYSKSKGKNTSGLISGSAFPAEQFLFGEYPCFDDEEEDYPDEYLLEEYPLFHDTIIGEKNQGGSLIGINLSVWG